MRVLSRKAVRIQHPSHGDIMDYQSQAYNLNNTYNTVQNDLANRNVSSFLFSLDI